MDLLRTPLRAPTEHGQSLIEPRPPAMLEALKQNRDYFDNVAHRLGNCSLPELRSSTKNGFLSAAVDYSAQYRDVSFAKFALQSPSKTSFIVGGHQPTLFHGGVWFKNFCLDSLAKATHSIAINLIVDNDLVGLSKILVPQRTDEGARFEAVAFDATGENFPFEMRRILDPGVFRSFPQRAAAALGSSYELIANRLWLLDTEAVGDTLGLRLAAMRHKYEEQAGLKTLELPLSALCRTKSFAVFFREIARRADEFRGVYNRALSDFRKAYRIRSRSHPVPRLEVDGDWIELPFWIWSNSAPYRKRLFVRTVANCLECTDRDGVIAVLPLQNFEEEFIAHSDRGIAIRPRALTTTMFVRIAAADYFLHGIGGAKYDELTGAMVKEFFGLEPPAFGVATATFRLTNALHSDEGPSPAKLTAEIRKLDELLRALQYHPERFVDVADCVAQEWGDRKRMLLSDAPEAGKRREFRQRIREVNARLGEQLNSVRSAFSLRRNEASRELDLARVLATREASFALFPTSLVECLRNLASC